MVPLTDHLKSTGAQWSPTDPTFLWCMTVGSYEYLLLVKAEFDRMQKMCHSVAAVVAAVDAEDNLVFITSGGRLLRRHWKHVDIRVEDDDVEDDLEDESVKDEHVAEEPEDADRHDGVELNCRSCHCCRQRMQTLLTPRRWTTGRRCCRG